MKPFLRILLLWLLIAALPIQGMAAAIQATCASENQGSAIMMMAPEHHHDMASHGHDHDDHHVASVDGSADKSGQLPDVADNHEHSTCSACASCCVGGVAPPSAAVQTPSYDSSNFVFVSAPSLVAGFIPPSLERPPKHISA